MGLLLVAMPAVLVVGFQRTMGKAESLAPIQLIGAHIVEKPNGWLPYAEAKRDYLTKWCAREDVDVCADMKVRPFFYGSALNAGRYYGSFSRGRKFHFEADWQAYNYETLSGLRKPSWNNETRPKPDLRHANANRAFLAGIDLTKARMEGADFYEANLQGAFLIDAQARGADFYLAEMQKIVLHSAQLQGARLSLANLQQASAMDANFHGAYLENALLQGADLYRAK